MLGLFLSYLVWIAENNIYGLILGLHSANETRRYKVQM